MFQNYIQSKLEKLVHEYLSAHPEVKVIAVGGSIGKTVTKHAIAAVLNQKYKVRMQDEDRPDRFSVPLGILGLDHPNDARNLLAWLKVLRTAKKRVNQPADTDIIIQELRSEEPGEIAHFGTYIRPSFGVVTGAGLRHIDSFGSLDKLAEEVMTLANFSNLAIINRDDIESRFSELLTNENVDTYGSTSAAEYRLEIKDFDINHGYSAWLVAPELTKKEPVDVRVIGEHSLRAVAAAMTVALKLGLSAKEIAEGVEDIAPLSGRMNVLRGMKHSVLLDDTYDASPASASAALQSLYSLQSPQRIAVVGTIRGLGTFSEEEHKKLGNLCDPNSLAWVVTVGYNAETFISAAKAKGCQVKSFKSPIEAGSFVHSVLEENAVVLATGSDETYTEEALKILLHNTAEDHFLVRQSAEWLNFKSRLFSDIS